VLKHEIEPGQGATELNAQMSSVIFDSTAESRFRARVLYSGDTEHSMFTCVLWPRLRNAPHSLRARALFIGLDPLGSALPFHP
jgi:hypothetical protein